MDHWIMKNAQWHTLHSQICLHSHPSPQDTRPFPYTQSRANDPPGDRHVLRQAHSSQLRQTRTFCVAAAFTTDTLARQEHMKAGRPGDLEIQAASPMCFLYTNYPINYHIAYRLPFSHSPRHSADGAALSDWVFINIPSHILTSFLLPYAQQRITPHCSNICCLTFNRRVRI